MDSLTRDSQGKSKSMNESSLCVYTDHVIKKGCAENFEDGDELVGIHIQTLEEKTTMYVLRQARLE
jgi:hypothetical protein